MYIFFDGLHDGRMIKRRRDEKLVLFLTAMALVEGGIIEEPKEACIGSGRVLRGHSILRVVPLASMAMRVN